MEPIIHTTAESTKEMITQNPKVLVVVSFSPTTLTKCFTQKSDKGKKDRKKRKTSRKTKVFRNENRMIRRKVWKLKRWMQDSK